MTEAARILYDKCPLCYDAFWCQERIVDCTGHPLWNCDVPREMRWLRCLSCEHVFTDGYFTDGTLQSLFSRVQENQRPGPVTEACRPIAARIIQSVAPRGEGRRWLDIGFGNGALMMTAAEFGYDVVGVDARKPNVDAMEAMGFSSYTCLSAIKQIMPFDVVSMADVLEHMPFPVDVLGQVYELLRTRGLLFLSMPNSDCPIWKMLDRRGENPYWREIEHYHNFGRARIEKLLNKFGFDPISYGVSERYRVGMEIIARKT